MDSLRRLYEWSEKTFWNTLTKKLSSFLFLSVINLVYLGIYLRIEHNTQASMLKNSISEAHASSIMSELDAGFHILAVLTGIALVVNICQILYLRYLIVRPIREITRIFNEISQGEADFSFDLPLQTHDELRQLAGSYNSFANKMRQIIGEVRKSSVFIARDAVQVQSSIGETAKSAHEQRAVTQIVFDSSNETTQAIGEVSRNTQMISDSTNVNLENARASMGKMLEIASRIDAVGEKVSHFNHTIEDLSERADSVNTFADLIKEVAKQTNLLALNAAIEAARAGEAGRGFAVVADEVRTLSERVNKASSEITENIAAMQAQVRNTGAENAEINTDIQYVRDVAGHTSEHFRTMVGDFERTGDQLLHIAAAMEELSMTNGQVHDSVNGIHKISGNVVQHMEESENRTRSLTVSTESVQELISRFKIGRGAFDFAIDKTRLFRDRLRNALEEMSKSGIDIFDNRYQPMGKTKPQKYKVSWGDEYTRRCQSVLEEGLASIPGCIYAVAVNTDGYLSAHNLKFSQPLTLDDAKDLVGNRTCRKFENPGELKAAKNTQPLLIRTYIRDTGEVLCDLVMPIHIGGRLWGNVRIGLPADRLTD